MTTNWRGVFPYLPTPLGADAQFDPIALAAIVQHCIDADVHGITPLGSSGEIAYLDSATRLKVIERTVDCVAGRLPVVSGIAGFTTAGLVNDAKAAVAAGSDGLLLILQSYFPLRPVEILQMIEAVTNAVDVPIVLYHHPTVAHVAITEAVVGPAYRDCGIAYIKDASGVLSNVSTWIDVTQGGMRVFSATAVSPTAAMQLGAVGWMSGPASVFPGESVEIYAHCERGDWRGALEVERRLEPALAVFRECGPARGVKTLLAALGRDAGQVTAPLLQITQTEILEVRATLQRTELLAD